MLFGDLAIPTFFILKFFRHTVYIITNLACEMQKLLGRDVKETEEEDTGRCTFGIEITSLQLSGRDLFSVWDFAGQIESFITHHLFISTQSTVFAVLVDLTSSIDDQRAQLLRWLGFIKMRNLGQVSDSMHSFWAAIVFLRICNS